jgi:ankyrin repeat protein
MALRSCRATAGVFLCLLATAAFAAPAGDVRVVEAVRSGDADALRALLNERADVNAPQADGATALAWAAHRNDLEAADLLIRAGADVNAANTYGVSPLSLACANGNAAMVGKLLDAKANPNAEQVTGETALMTCSRSGSVEAVNLLLTRGADPNASEKQKGQTALMWAVSRKHAAVAKALIEGGADVNAASKVAELTPPMRAVTYTKDVYFPKFSGGFTPLMFAARSGDLESARVLLAAKADINAVPKADGIGDGSALVVATASGHEDLAVFLLENGAKPNTADGYGITPLHWALMEGIRNLVGGGSSPTDRFWYHANMPNLVKALLARGADPNARIQHDFPPYDNTLFGHTLGNNLPQISLAGATPFMLAAASGDVGSMRVLVEGRGDPKLVTTDSTSPLMVAAGVGRERETLSEDQHQRFLEAVKLSVMLGGDVNARNKEGRTALHAAAFLGAKEAITFLVEKGANLEATDMYGQTPLSIALGDPEGKVYRQLPGDAYDYRFRQPRVQKEVADLLVQLGAKPFTGKYRDRSGE